MENDTINYRIQMTNDAVFHVIISIGKDKELWSRFTTKPWCETSAVASVFSCDFSICDKVNADMKLAAKELNVFSSEGGLIEAHHLIKQKLKDICGCDVLFDTDY